MNDQSLKIKEKIKASIESINRRSKGCPPTYPHSWLPILDSDEIKKGETKSIFALGLDLVIYRGFSGRVYVLEAYCIHFGAHLGLIGNVVGDDIKCPLHGCQYDNQGVCVSIQVQKGKFHKHYLLKTF